MSDALLRHGGLRDAFELQISTDAARTYKPDPRAYALQAIADLVPEDRAVAGRDVEQVREVAPAIAREVVHDVGQVADAGVVLGSAEREGTTPPVQQEVCRCTAM